MNYRKDTHLGLWRHAVLAGSVAGIVVLVAACGGSSSKSSTAAPASAHSASSQSASTLAKFCSDDANDANLENQLGDDPDPSDPATHALLVTDLNVLKAEVGEAPNAIRSDVQTLEGVIATAAAGKTEYGESKFDKYTNAVDAIDNWTNDNCPDTSDSDGNGAPAAGNTADNNSTNQPSDSTGETSDQSSATDDSTNSTVMNDCVEYFESGADGSVPDNPTTTCNCVISYLTSPDGLAAAGGGSYSVADLESEFEQSTEEGIPSVAADDAGSCLQGTNADPSADW